MANKKEICNRKAAPKCHFTLTINKKMAAIMTKKTMAYN